MRAASPASAGVMWPRGSGGAASSSSDRSVASLTSLAGRRITVDEILPSVIAHAREVFQRDFVETAEDARFRFARAGAA